MSTTEVHVSGQMFILSSNSVVEALKNEVVMAVRGGGSFVDFDTVGHGIMSMLITTMIPVRFQTIEGPQDQVDEGEERSLAIDSLVEFDAFLRDLDW
jgi:hypothetical protein